MRLPAGRLDLDAALTVMKRAVAHLQASRRPERLAADTDGAPAGRQAAAADIDVLIGPVGMKGHERDAVVFAVASQSLMETRRERRRRKRCRTWRSLGCAP